MAYRLGVDVGGTFTDLLLFDDATGKTLRSKVPSTLHDPSEAVVSGTRGICEQVGIEPGAIEDFLHGTTVATNAVLEGKGARVGLVVTEGYRQVLQITRSLVPGGLAACSHTNFVRNGQIHLPYMFAAGPKRPYSTRSFRSTGLGFRKNLPAMAGTYRHM